MSETQKNWEEEGGSSKKENNRFILAKKRLSFLREEMVSFGADQKLLESWDELVGKIEKGREKEVLLFLEKLKFIGEKTLEIWRKTVLSLSLNLEKVSFPKELRDAFLKDEFPQHPIFQKENAGENSSEEKMQTLESEIRLIFGQMEFLENSIQEMKKKKKLSSEEEKILKEDEKMLASIPEELLILRRIRNSFYREKYAEIN